MTTNPHSLIVETLNDMQGRDHADTAHVILQNLAATGWLVEPIDADFFAERAAYTAPVFKYPPE